MKTTKRTAKLKATYAAADAAWRNAVRTCADDASALYAAREAAAPIAAYTKRGIVLVNGAFRRMTEDEIERLRATEKRDHNNARRAFYRYAADTAAENLDAFADHPAGLLSAALSAAAAVMRLGTLPALDPEALRPEIASVFDGRGVDVRDIVTGLETLAARYPEEP